MLDVNQTALSAYLRTQARQLLGANGTPLQYIAVLAHAWQCSMLDVVERTRVRLHRNVTNQTGKTTRMRDVR